MTVVGLLFYSDREKLGVLQFSLEAPRTMALLFWKSPEYMFYNNSGNQESFSHHLLSVYLTLQCSYCLQIIGINSNFTQQRPGTQHSELPTWTFHIFQVEALPHTATRLGALCESPLHDHQMFWSSKKCHQDRECSTYLLESSTSPSYFSGKLLVH